MLSCLLTYKTQVTLALFLAFKISSIINPSQKQEPFVLIYLMSDPVLKVNLRKVLSYWFGEAAAMMHLSGFLEFTKCLVTEDYMIISFEHILKGEQKTLSFPSPHPNKQTNK